MERVFLPKDEFMIRCLSLAKLAADMGEVPVGAVIEKNGEIIGYGHNMVETLKNPLAHAEILAIEMAVKNLGDWRLSGANLYVSLEPCPMCTGAAVNSRISRVVFGAHDEKYFGTKIWGNDFTKNIEIYRGFMEDECSNLLKKFFINIRKNLP